MDIESLTLAQLREIARLVGPTALPGTKRPKNHSYTVGSCVFIRTVTCYYTGRIAAVTTTDVVLEDAAWIADTGRFSTALTTGALSEVEPYPTGTIVSRGGIIDVAPWAHPLPRTVK